MSDLIKREDAIEEVCGVVIDEFDTSPTMGYEVAEKALSALPSADDNWIPVSERLPSVGEDVLFCDSKWTEEGCLRVDGDWWQFRWFSVMPKEKVIAWMPLPKPYKGGDSE